jgi:FkbM family methyltransferase
VFGNDVIGNELMVDGIFEGEYIRDLFYLLKLLNIDVKNSSAIDIGAGIGNHSIKFSKYFSNVISFEPNPRTFDLLAANTKRLTNVKIYNWGCSSSDAVIRFHKCFNNIGSSSSILKIASNNESEIVVKPLDEIINDLNNVALIKIDIEGMEYSYLIGAEKVISKFNPIICLEQHEAEFNSKFNETASIDWLCAKGYRMFLLLQKKRRCFIPRHLNTLLRLFFGRINGRVIVEHEKLPKSDYAMIFEVHSRLFE